MASYMPPSDFSNGGNGNLYGSGNYNANNLGGYMGANSVYGGNEAPQQVPYGDAMHAEGYPKSENPQLNFNMMMSPGMQKPMDYGNVQPDISYPVYPQNIPAGGAGQAGNPMVTNDMFTQFKNGQYFRNENLPLRPLTLERDYLYSKSILKSNLSFKEAATAMLSMASSSKKSTSGGSGKIRATAKARKSTVSVPKQNVPYKSASGTQEPPSVRTPDEAKPGAIFPGMMGEQLTPSLVSENGTPMNWVPIKKMTSTTLTPRNKQFGPMPKGGAVGAPKNEMFGKMNVVEEMNLEKEMTPNVKRNTSSSAAIMMETFQILLSNKKKRIRNCLVEDCRHSIGEQPKIDVQYNSLDVGGEKVYQLSEILSSLLPYHLFYFENILEKFVPFQPEGYKGVKEDVDKLDKEVEMILNGCEEAESLRSVSVCIIVARWNECVITTGSSGLVCVE
ncbi:hypothetical protein BEWA_031240 [Theileria equi strain WA]|uniref:Uncharacterized protein n=1 Tax=Theileria equi strain WA TaxID=1537102 RepID=L0AZ26_THEEQ|nr:hypothetical protein BEWA_031240 [Theileria equi strain WA]AFZ80271.1 hypothetical protein BEWA_031240 [Theileria equi strain WA]|eukprot:XP_004829937.1 hypothetical protein BEWA_031240 [Theileria equi strain WA]